MKFRFAKVPKAFAVPSEKVKPDDGKRRIKGKFKLSDIDEFIKVGKMLKTWDKINESFADAYMRVYGLETYNKVIEIEKYFTFAEWYEQMCPMAYQYFQWFMHRIPHTQCIARSILEPYPYEIFECIDGVQHIFEQETEWLEDFYTTRHYGELTFATIRLEKWRVDDKKISITIHDSEEWLIRQIEKRLSKVFKERLVVTEKTEYSSSKNLWKEKYKIAQCDDETVIAKIEYEKYFKETENDVYFDAVITGFDTALTREIMKRIRYCFSMPFSKKKKRPENRNVIFLKRR